MMDYLVDSNSAAGGGRGDDTPAIQSAIDSCAAAGGGRVVLLEGRRYSASSIVLKSNVELHLQDGAELIANTGFQRFIKPSELEYDPPRPNAAHKPPIVWLYAFGQSNISITGRGTLVGNADSVTGPVNRYISTHIGLPRPTLIYLEGCRNVTISDVSIRKAPFWTLHPAGCEDVVISRVRIQNDLNCANSDGIDPDHCRNVLIEDCDIQCADDCIVLKNTLGNTEYGSCENITVRGCRLVSTSAAVKIGTESFGDFNTITVSGCSIDRSNRGLSIQLRDGGSVDHVLFENISVDTRRFSEDWWGCGEPISVTVLPRTEQTVCGTVSGIVFKGIRCDSENGILLYSHEDGHIDGIRFEDVELNLHRKTKWFDNTYDLRPCAMAGLIQRETEPLFLFHAGNVDCSNILIHNSLIG